MQLSWKIKAGVLMAMGIGIGVAMSSMGEAADAPPNGGFARLGDINSNSPVDVQLEDASGRPLSVFSHQGERFFMGEEGERYAIRLVNRGDRRMEAVVTVDGRDVVSGELGSFEQRGYIVPAHGSVLVEGFRRSLDQVASFRFSTPERSYSTLKGSPQHVGVIGLAVFEEQADRQALAEPRDGWGSGRGDSTERPARRPSGASPAPAPGEAGGRWKAKEEKSTAELGTGWGENRNSRVDRESFTRKNPTRPDALLSVRYDSRAGLEARGIRVFDAPQRFAQPAGPNAFPAQGPATSPLSQR